MDRVMVVVVEYLAKVPEAIWGVLVGSALSLLGIWQANKHAKGIQLVQLEYDSKERQRDRQMQMRRDVYLTAVDAITKVTACLGKMANLKITNEELEQDFQIFSAAIGRIQMVASESTLRDVSAIYREYGKAFMILFRDRYLLLLRQSDIEIAEKWTDTYQEEQRRFIEMMRAYNLEASNDRKRWDAIQKQSDFVSERLNETTRKLAQLRDTHLHETLLLAQKLPAIIEPLSELQARALSAIRSELELSRSESVLLEELRKTGIEMKSEFAKTVQAVKESCENATDEERKP